jgi:hypothetical protein
MRGETVESQKERMLAKLREAGAAGLTKAGLGVKDAKGKAAQALRELLNERLAANLGNLRQPCYVLLQYFNPLERACDQIERYSLLKKAVRENTIGLIPRSEFEKGFKGPKGEIWKKFDEAIDWLLKTGRLLKFQTGRNTYFVHVSQVSPSLSSQGKAPAVTDTKVDSYPAAEIAGVQKDTVMSAYSRVKTRLGYSNIPIYELQQELGVPMEKLKSFIVEEARSGGAALSIGDWSLSSEEVRSGVIELGGYRYLLVRFSL